MENPKQMGEAPIPMRTAKYPYGSAADVIMSRMSGWYDWLENVMGGMSGRAGQA